MQLEMRLQRQIALLQKTRRANVCIIEEKVGERLANRASYLKKTLTKTFLVQKEKKEKDSRVFLHSFHRI